MLVWCVVVAPCLVWILYWDCWKGGWFPRDDWAWEARWRRWRGLEPVDQEDRRVVVGENSTKVKKVRFITITGTDGVSLDD